MDNQPSKWVAVGLYRVTSPDLIKKRIGNYFGISNDRLLSKRRTPDLVLARHFIWYFLRILCKKNVKTIGDEYNRDHSTVVHGLRRIKEGLEVGDDFYSNHYQEINRMLGDLTWSVRTTTQNNNDNKKEYESNYTINENLRL